jgi:hypothetical protein
VSRLTQGSTGRKHWPKQQGGKKREVGEGEEVAGMEAAGREKDREIEERQALNRYSKFQNPKVVFWFIICLLSTGSIKVT